MQEVLQQINAIDEEIQTNQANLNKLFQLLEKANNQAMEIQAQIGDFQMVEQRLREEKGKLEIIKEFLEEREVKENDGE